MIKHIVTWKLDDSYSATQKEEILKKLSEQLLGLKNTVEVLQSIQVYVNNPEANPSNYDLLLDSKFATIADLNAYQVHPEHLKVGAYLKTLKLQRAAIDYSI